MATNEPAIAAFLDTVGDGTGAANANGDYSVTPQTFAFAPAPGELIQIATFSVSIRDDDFMNARYGNIVGGLGTGYTIRFKDTAGSDEPLFGGRTFKTNVDFPAARGSASIFNEAGGGGQLLLSRWNVRETFDVLLSLNGSLGQRLEVTLNDDFSSIEEHLFQVQGYKDV